MDGGQEKETVFLKEKKYPLLEKVCFEENYRPKVGKLQFWQNLHLEKFLDWNSPPFLGEMGGGKTLLFLKKRFLHLQDINFLFGQLETQVLRVELP